jgi:hypothetical protein
MEARYVIRLNPIVIRFPRIEILISKVLKAVSEKETKEFEVNVNSFYLD